MELVTLAIPWSTRIWFGTQTREIQSQCVTSSSTLNSEGALASGGWVTDPATSHPTPRRSARNAGPSVTQSLIHAVTEFSHSL